MTTVNRYVELPLPHAWEPVIQRLKPTDPGPSKLSLPCPIDLMLTVFEVLNSRECHILLNRYGKRRTLDQIGQELDLTRERIRQLEKKIFAKLQLRARGFGERMHEFTEAVYESGFLVADMPQDERPGWPNATLDEVWRCALATYARAYTKPYLTEKVAEGSWITYDSYRVQPSLFKRVFNDKQRFMSISEVAAYIGAEPQICVQAMPFFDGIFLTQSSLVGSNRWTILQFMEAIAWELHAEGFDDWHFSEMARALETIYPKNFGGIISRNVAAALSRGDATMFQHAGQKGVWQLRAVGDGNRGNRDAVIAVFEENPILMHYTDVVKRLNRRVNPETIHALLQRDETFRSYGDGVYGLSKKQSRHPVHRDDASEDKPTVGDFELTDLLLDILGDTKALLISRDEHAPSATLKPSRGTDDFMQPRAYELSCLDAGATGLIEDIMRVVRGHASRLTSREIAKILGREKKLVNRCLYLHLMRAGRVAHDEDRRWYVTQKPRGAPVRGFEASG